MSSLDLTHLASHIPCAKSWTLSHPAATKEEINGGTWLSRSNPLKHSCCGYLWNRQCPNATFSHWSASINNNATIAPVCVNQWTWQGLEIALMSMFAANWCSAEVSTQVSGASPLCDTSWKYIVCSYKEPDMLPHDMHLSREDPLLCSYVPSFLNAASGLWYMGGGDMKATRGSVSERHKATRYVKCVIKKRGRRCKKKKY